MQKFFHQFISQNTAVHPSTERFFALYRLEGNEKEAYEKACDICIEQTVEFPEDLIPNGLIRESVFGKIEHFEKQYSTHYARISYSVESTAGEFSQFLNVLFGNISLKPGIRLERIELSPTLLKAFPGPRFGINGIRKRINKPTGPLIATALKPMGLSAKGLAELAYQFALGGIDIIKDDHGLSNQPFAPFRERIARCAESIEKAKQITGIECLYAPNITAPFDEILERAITAKENGAGALLIAPGIVGFDALRMLAHHEAINIPIIAHPSFLGSFAINTNGISPACLFGTLCRIAGADATIYPNFGGRFSFSREDCNAIVRACTEDSTLMHPIFPMPGGGMTVELIDEMKQFYGDDVIYLMGGGLFRHSSDLVKNCHHLRALINSNR
ncbi:MAG: RuBisCO large subunit C-terminal-like domain-containing protein [Spirochaetes bacterium]|nr:RuBisCO large subunit C-terminal-like domain-containing protein [Spirochaetota bacterium]